MSHTTRRTYSWREREVNKPVESDLIEAVAPVAVVETVAGVGAEAATVAASGVLPELPLIKVLTLA